MTAPQFAGLEADPLPRCIDCAHPLYLHRENMPTSRSQPGDPVPCYFARADGHGGYTYCGCLGTPREV